MKQLPILRRPYFARRVLDVGAGHNPFYGATHLLEIDVERGSQRGGTKHKVPKGTKLVVGDVQAIPFRSGRFDYVYASHVLEHVDSPFAACREIVRVARAGYIETPSPFLEQGLALAGNIPGEEGFHKWLVFSPLPGVLAFEPKTMDTVSWFCPCPDGQFLKDFYESLDFRVAQHFFRSRAKTTSFYWKSSFDVDIRRGKSDCGGDRRTCRFSEMRKTLLLNCNDPLGSPRLFRLRKTFPRIPEVFRRHGHQTLFI
jgi:ubiquinone/menaquinone biosynthesis C-methylase UbiE